MILRHKFAIQRRWYGHAKAKRRATGQSSVTGSMLVPKASESFWHDLDGNLLSDSLWTNRWNAENRVVQVEGGTGLTASKRMREAWTHLPDGRWIERIVSTNNGSAYYPAFTNRFVWDGQVLMAILNHTNGLVMSFVRGLDLAGSTQGAGGVGGVLVVNFAPSTLNAQPSTHLVSYDGNGNVVALADASTGSSSGQFEYGPFSEPIRVTGTAAEMMPLRFSTMYEDSVTGDRKYLFRDLNPSTGRWKSGDPIGEQGGYSMLAVLMNDTINSADAFGLISIEEKCCVCYISSLLRDQQDERLQREIILNINFLDSASAGITRVLDDLISIGRRGGRLGFALLARTACGPRPSLRVALDPSDAESAAHVLEEVVHLNAAYPFYFYVGDPESRDLLKAGGEGGKMVLAHELGHLYLDIRDPWNVYVVENTIRKNFGVPLRDRYSAAVEDHPNRRGDQTGLYWPKGTYEGIPWSTSSAAWFSGLRNAQRTMISFVLEWGDMGCSE